MISKPGLTQCFACLFALVISCDLCAGLNAIPPWNGEARLSEENLKIEFVRKALQQLGFEITDAKRASQAKQVVLTPSAKLMDAKILSVTSSGVKIEYDIEAEYRKYNYSSGTIISPIGAGEATQSIGNYTIQNHRGHVANTTTLFGPLTSKPGRYDVTVVVLGQEVENGPWYLLDSFRGVVDVEK